VWAERLACGEAPPRQGTGEWLRLEAGGRRPGVHAGVSMGGAGPRRQFELLLSNVRPSLLDVNLRRSGRGEGLAAAIIFPGAPARRAHQSNAPSVWVSGLALIWHPGTFSAVARPRQAGGLPGPELKSACSAPGFSGNPGVVNAARTAWNLAPRLGPAGGARC